MTEALRLAEPLGALSLVTDLGMGFPPESSVRAVLLACAIADRLGLDEEVRRHIYYATLLRFVGCVATSHESAVTLGGDDIAVNHRMALVD